jgi:hypothetical protein
MVTINRILSLAICSLVIKTSAIPVPEFQPTSDAPAIGFNTTPNHPLGGGAATLRKTNISPPTCGRGTTCDSRTNKEPTLSPPTCENGTACGSENIERQSV